MRGTLRTAGTIAFCMIVMVSLAGCRTGAKSDGAPASQVPACPTTPVAGENNDGGTTPSTVLDATKPVLQSNDPRSSLRPPILYGREPDILPLSDEQVERVQKLFAEQQPGKEVWFIYVLFSRKRTGISMDFYSYAVDVYCKPDQQSARVRRGAAVYAHLSGRVLPPIVRSFFYAHLCETDAGFSSDLAVPEDLARLPFNISGDISDEDIVEVVRFIRSGPAVPVATVHTSSGTERLFRQDPSLDPAAPIDGISREGEDICVYVTGPKPYIFAVYHCRKMDGVWTVTGVGRGVT